MCVPMLEGDKEEAEEEEKGVLIVYYMLSLYLFLIWSNLIKKHDYFNVYVFAVKFTKQATVVLTIFS